MGDPALSAERINCPEGSVELKNCGSRVRLDKGETEKGSWNQILQGLEQQAKELGLGFDLLAVGTIRAFWAEVTLSGLHFRRLALAIVCGDSALPTHPWAFSDFPEWIGQSWIHPKH